MRRELADAWHTSGRLAFSPINATSKKPYRGINTVCLWAAAQAKGYGSGEWATYQQWQEKGAQVRKGEKATLVVFWKFANESTETDDGDSPKSGSRLLFTRGYSVFNAAQVDGYTPKVDVDIPIPYGSNPETCPVRVLQIWIETGGITEGPLFRSISRHGRVQTARLSPVDVARVVKKLALRAGLDPAKYAGHSLRSGHATSAAIAGASERSIMNQTRHRSVQMVRRYILEGSLFRENSASKLGL